MIIMNYYHGLYLHQLLDLLCVFVRMGKSTFDLAELRFQYTVLDNGYNPPCIIRYETETPGL